MKINPAFVSALSIPAWERPTSASELSELRSQTELAAINMSGTPHPDSNPRWQDFEVPGTFQVPVRVYFGESESDSCVLVYLHGGGWVLGSKSSHDGVCRQFARATGLTIVSVDYRLAPEAPFPAGLEDVATVLNWLRAPNLISESGFTTFCLVGDSAGGNLVAATTIREVRAGRKVDYQVLLYPALDAQQNTASYLEFADGFGLSASDMDWYWSQYVTNTNDFDKELVSPIKAGSAFAWPPTFILSAEIDVLRDEAEEMAHIIQQSGMEAICVRALGMPHGFLTMGSLSTDVASYIDAVSSWIRRKMGR